MKRYSDIKPPFFTGLDILQYEVPLVIVELLHHVPPITSFELSQQSSGFYGRGLPTHSNGCTEKEHAQCCSAPTY
jgi:hypothetical protein